MRWVAARVRASRQLRNRSAKGKEAGGRGRRATRCSRLSTPDAILSNIAANFRTPEYIYRAVSLQGSPAGKDQDLLSTCVRPAMFKGQANRGLIKAVAFRSLKLFKFRHRSFGIARIGTGCLTTIRQRALLSSALSPTRDEIKTRAKSLSSDLLPNVASARFEVRSIALRRVVNRQTRIAKFAAGVQPPRHKNGLSCEKADDNLPALVS
ncbi:hypothetical protein ACVMIH_007366 [Bradyrhizobium sp. USDA 4503]